jgi:hypothetical protein
MPLFQLNHICLNCNEIDESRSGRRRSLFVIYAQFKPFLRPHGSIFVQALRRGLLPRSTDIFYNCININYLWKYSLIFSLQTWLMIVKNSAQIQVYTCRFTQNWVNVNIRIHMYGQYPDNTV